MVSNKQAPGRGIRAYIQAMTHIGGEQGARQLPLLFNRVSRPAVFLERFPMSEEIRVTVVSVGPGRPLALRWIDPGTGRPRFKSSKTRNKRRPSGRRRPWNMTCERASWRRMPGCLGKISFSSSPSKSYPGGLRKPG